ncbi:tRNA pseudouridine(13) synthase TruD [Thiocapsa bogorovii]|uniref:tRNA pseudouridine(13) synthase TruD n=1 Tax=Thiocapsa bogorovii TaxID=521689 RepID=UPI001E52B4DC|nr:tRNA pseudouridine(13) synthase TruD [Thiocapsa bogorovii]UHD15360.1 tRNA pseudouridine(13) synthase TruD [Thiocapsa bogorovii]
MSLPIWSPVDALPGAYGAPLACGRLRARPEDFLVEEQLGFAPDGEGDHLLLRVRKTGANTEWTARRLARIAGVPVSAVGYAGLKDRHAVALQWFSIPRPRDGTPDWSILAEEGIEVLESHPHRRKLKRGALAGNRFQILVRDLDPETIPGLDERLAAIRVRGIPNFFGEQRFGHDHSNLVRAHALFAGSPGRVPRHQSGLWLSAARSQIFNEVLAERVRRGDWDRPIEGDCLQLAGSNSYFLAETIDAATIARGEAMDVHPTGPLWGKGELPSRGSVRQLEDAVGIRFPTWCEGLAAFGLAQERRSLRLPVADLGAQRVDGGLRLTFSLPAGAYATTVLREIVDANETAAIRATPQTP